MIDKLVRYLFLLSSLIAAKNDTILAFNSADGNQAVLFRWIGEHEKMIDIGNTFDQSGAEAIFACSIAELVIRRGLTFKSKLVFNLYGKNT